MSQTENRTAILVAGGAGYIGSHTAKELSRQGYKPVVLDSFTTGNRFAARFGPVYEGNISDGDLLRRIFTEHAIKGAILFAGHAYVGESTQNPRKYYRNNLSASLALLDVMVECKVNHLVFSSSCSIYGMQAQGPIAEEQPKDPLSPYAESKWFFERMLHWTSLADGLRSVSLRYFNAAGADPDGELGENHDPETHLIPLAIDAARGGPALKIFGTDYPTPDGTAIRDYIHVTDLAAAHIAALRYLHQGGESTALNLGTGTGSSVQDVVAGVERVSGRKVVVEYGPRRLGDAPALVANPARAKQVLGWEPQYSSLSSILRTAWRWQDELRDRVLRESPTNWPIP